MYGLKTHFEQVPIEVAKKIAREEAQRQRDNALAQGERFLKFREREQPANGRNGNARTKETMEDTGLRFPEWQTPLQEVILEFNREKLPGKIQNMEQALNERLRQLSMASDGLEERTAISDALSLLRIIKRDRPA